MFPDEIKQKAIELSKSRSAGQVLQSLERLKEFRDEDLPTERTINRWKKQVTLRTRETMLTEHSGELMITDDGIYRKILDTPNWMKKPPK